MATAAKYAKETFWAAASKGVAFLFYYSLIFYLTRRMSVEVWGKWSAFWALLNILILLADQGINDASKRYIAEARDSKTIGGIVRTTLILRVLSSLLYAGVIVFLVHPLLLWLHQPDYLGLIQRSLVLIALYGIMDYFKTLFEALHRLRFTFVINLLEHGLKFLLVLVLFGRGETFVTIITAFSIAVAVALAGGVILALRALPGLLTSPAQSPTLRQAYLYSLPIFLMSIAGFISLEIDTIMLKQLRTDYETGIYSVAKQIVMFLPHLSLAFTMGVIPGVSVFNEDTARSQKSIFYRVLGGIVGIYLILCAGLAGFAIWGVKLVFGPEYYASSTPLLVLIPFVLFNAVTIYSGNLMLYRGLAWQRSVNSGITVILNVLLNLWLIPIWGAVGAAAASSIAYLPDCLLNLRAAHNAFAVGEITAKTVGTGH